MKEGENKLSCPICDLHVVRLYELGKSKVCKYCKKDKLKNGKFTRKKVTHNFEAANKRLDELRKEHNKRV